MRPVSSQRGFTLLEIIVSLAIAALGIAAVAKATGSAATVAAETRERMLAVWATSNRLTEMKISRSWPAPGQYDSTSAMGGRTWYLTQVVSATDVETVRRVDIEVYTDVDREKREYHAFGYIARYEAPQDPVPESDDQQSFDEDEQAAGIEDEEIPLPGDEEPPPGDDAETEPEPDDETAAGESG